MKSFEPPQAVEFFEQLSLWTGLSQSHLSQLALVLGSVLIIGLFVFGYRKTRKLHQKLERLQHDLHIANSSARGMGQQLLALEKSILRQKSVNSHVQQHQPVSKPQAPAADDDEPRYDNVGYSKVSPITSRTQTPTRHIAAQSGLSDDGAEDFDQVYDTARQWLAQGYDVSYVMKKSGLSQAEVSLMSALQKKAGSSADNIHHIK